MKYTDEQLINRVETHASGFEGWRKGVSDIWVRSNADPPDAFDDKVYTYNCREDGKRPDFIMVCTGTSHAGVYYQQNFQQYNPDGVAVLCADTYVYNSHEYGFHRGYRAYRQAKGFPHTRDNDRDNKAENYGNVSNEIILANCHRASAFRDTFVIGKYSAACLVRNRINQWNAWLAYMNRRPLSVGILKEF